VHVVTIVIGSCMHVVTIVIGSCMYIVIIVISRVFFFSIFQYNSWGFTILSSQEFTLS